MKKLYFSYVVTFDGRPHIFGYTIKKLEKGVVTVELIDDLAKELCNAAKNLDSTAINCTIISWQEISSSNH